MTFTGKQSGGWVESHPASSWQKHFSPCMQVGEINFGAAGAIQRFQVGRQLNQITGHKPGGQSKVSERLHQQPSCVATRTFLQLQRLVGSLNSRFHTNFVINFGLHPSIQRHNKVNRFDFADVDTVDEGLPFGSWLLHFQKRSQLFTKRFIVFERKHFRR